MRSIINNRESLAIISICLLTMFLTSCARSVRGHAIDKGAIQKITKGQTTKKEVISLFGKATTYSMNRGVERLGYSYTKVASKTNPLSFIPIVGMFFEGQSGNDSSQSLNFAIQNGVVVDYSYSESGQESSTDF